MSNIIKSRKVIVDTESYLMKNTVPQFQDNPLLQNAEVLSSESLEDSEIEAEQDIDYEALHREKLEEIELERQRIISDAKAEAEQIIMEAEANRESVYNMAKEEGHNAGMEEGYQQGYQAGYNEAKAIIDDAINIKNASIQETNAYTASIEGEVVELVLDSVKKLVGKIKDEDGEFVLSLIDLGLKKITASESLVLKVNETEVQLIETFKNSILAQNPRIEAIAIKADPSLSPGDCLIVTESGEVDARISTQIPALEELFRSYLSNE